MKKVIIMMMAATLLLSASSFAAHVKKYVNEKAISAFARDFTGATNVSWQEKENYYLVEFRIDETRYMAAYTEDGNLLVTSKGVKVAELPFAVTQAVIDKYRGYELGKNATEMTFGGHISYNLTISNNKEILYLKMNGSGAITIDKRIEL